ncbi:MAG TPA: glycosyltransferase family 2 protein [Flavobacterium sp.]|nr:glycosyltransferase family 2 protein [Flavobacterium sp.]
MAFFSIIIPLYNKQDYIENTLKSIFNQTFTDFEIIIVNDGSTDNSYNLVQSLSDKRIRLFSTENRGVSAARNFAMSNAAGEYFAFMDADDFWYPQHLEKIAYTLSKYNHLKVFTTLLEVETRNGVFPGNYTHLSEAEIQEVDLFETSLARTILSGSTTVIHKNVRQKIGPFNEQLSNGEDTEYWIRIGFNYKIGVYNAITARHVYVSGSLSHHTFDMKKHCHFEQFAEMEKNNPPAKKMIDINRFSLALQCKINRDTENYRMLTNSINRESLSAKQRLLLRLPPQILVLLQQFKGFLERKNIRLTAF